MSLTSTLNAAVTGLQVNQKGLEIASHNIGNVNTEGYSRRVIHQEAADTAGLGARGVNISQIERVADEFLTSQIRTESATLGRSAVRDRYFTNIQGMFGDIGSDSSIGQRIADMTTRIESLAIDPESPTAASGLIEEAQGFTRDLNTIADEILRLRSEADLEIEHAIAGINDDLQLIADLNDKIATRGAVAGADVGDMLDQRDQALKRVGE
ncbi:MAG: flagellar basal body protein, partial [Alphaproteobacteria bacterium]